MEPSAFERAEVQPLIGGISPQFRKTSSHPKRPLRLHITERAYQAIEHALAVRAWLTEQGLDAGPLSALARIRQGSTPPITFKRTIPRLESERGAIIG